MQLTFEHLLGLNATSALAILKGYGIVDVTVVPTAAPPHKGESPQPMTLEPSFDNELLTEARVVAVRDDGRTLVVSRFHVGDPKTPII